MLNAIDPSQIYLGGEITEAWDLIVNDGKTSVRGGFGVYYDRIEGNIMFPLGNN